LHLLSVRNKTCPGFVNASVSFSFPEALRRKEIEPSTMADFKEVMERRRKQEVGIIWADQIFDYHSEGNPESSSKIYLGAGRDARNLEQLKSHGITHIINCADDVPNFHETMFAYLNLNVGDFGADKGISRVFDEAAEYVDSVMKIGGNILIHCANGSNRSATVSIAVLMQIEKVPLSVAWRQVASAHKQTAPLQDNRAELLKFEKRLLGKCTMEESRGTLQPIE